MTYETRKFGGKTYRFHGDDPKKVNAEQIAINLRRHGNLARVVGPLNTGEGRLYMVYSRKR